MIEKEENILRKYLSNDQIIVLMQNDILNLVAMAMRAYKNEDKLVKNLALSVISNCTICNSQINYKGVCEMCYTKL